MASAIETDRPSLSSSGSRRADALLEGLNEPQRQAVTHGDGPLLILAGAGSGKTRVLTHRVAHLIFTGQARPGEILAITFTNKAAAEMRSRVELLLGRDTRGMWLSTFHSACARILRAHAPALGYTAQFTIYDQADARRVAKRAMEELGVDPKRHSPTAVHNRISQAKNLLLDAGAYRDMGGGEFEGVVGEVYELYSRQLQRSNAMDFDDLLLLTVNAMERFPDLREAYANTFRHVLVDEYQDTNHAQYRLLAALCGRPGDAASGHRNLAVVGDDAQSVYGFRGADIRNILDFQQDFPDATVIKLEQNYRSTQTILRAANAIIANNRGAMPKQLWSALGDGSPLVVRDCDDEHSEARFVVGEIELLLADGRRRGDLAVFYRTNAMSRVIEDALVRNDLPYQVIGGAKFYERAEIKDAVAYLSLLVNPHDVVSFMRIANSPRRGLGQTSLARIVGHAASIDMPVFATAADPHAVPGLTRAAVKGLSGFMQTMSQLRQRVTDGDSVASVLEAVLNDTLYIEALQNEARDATTAVEAEGRLENLEQLVEVAREFDDTWSGEGSPVDAFLQQIALTASVDERDAVGDGADDGGLITLMTLHNAKGTEFPVVFIVGCEEGVIPHSRAIDEGATEEERRLFYVGVTRAMHELYLSHAERRAVFGTGVFSRRSRFLDEIPVELTDDEQSLAPAAEADGDQHAAPSGHGGLLAGAGLGGRLGAPAGLGVPGMAGRRRAARAAAATSAPRFGIGDDVVHATFGEGVVTGVDHDGLVIVRFAHDGTERTLLAEYAPIRKASA
jgi:DNA helicase-2/ATP-dependent DNA helicase PcrA